MRAMWKGALSFGLVNVPVKLYSATEDHDVRFHQVHAADGGRIRMKRVCTVCGETVDYKDLAKAYEADDGRVVVMDDSDFADLPVPGRQDIEIVEFVPREQVDPLLFDRSYYLEPDGRSVKPYVLLREALQTTERTAIARVVLRSKQQLAALRVRDDVLVLQTMLWPDEVRQPDFGALEEDVEIRPQELQMAESLIDNLAADFDPSQFHDEYREALLAVIEGKLAGGEGVQTAVVVDQPEGPVVVDLMAALQESVERTRAARAAKEGEGATPTPAARTRTTAAKVDDAEVAEKPAKPARKRRSA
ncbi:MAG: Ku protein [Candidatus Nanopelagicales bacterium]